MRMKREATEAIAAKATNNTPANVIVASAAFAPSSPKGFWTTSLGKFSSLPGPKALPKEATTIPVAAVQATKRQRGPGRWPVGNSRREDVARIPISGTQSQLDIHTANSPPAIKIGRASCRERV